MLKRCPPTNTSHGSGWHHLFVKETELEKRPMFLSEGTLPEINSFSVEFTTCCQVFFHRVMEEFWTTPGRHEPMRIPRGLKCFPSVFFRLPTVSVFQTPTRYPGVRLSFGVNTSGVVPTSWKTGHLATRTTLHYTSYRSPDRTPIGSARVPTEFVLVILSTMSCRFIRLQDRPRC